MAYRTPVLLPRLLIALLAAQASACIIISDDGTSAGTSSSTTSDASTSGATSTASDASTSGATSTGTDSASTTAASDTATSDTASGTASGTTAETSTSGTTVDTTGSTTGGADPGFDPADPGVQMCADPFADDPVEIMSAAIKGDILFLSIGYGGGCQTHDFGLCWDGAFAESDPVQASLVLAHDAKGDLCEAYITEEKQLELTSLKKAWQDAYQQQSGTIIIHLAGWTDPISYFF